MSKDDSREPRLSSPAYAECLARDLRPGHVAEVWTEEARAYVFRCVTQVEHTGRGTGKPRVQVWFEGIPLSREYMPGDRFHVTAESFERQVFAPCQWGGHMLHRAEGAVTAAWLDREGRRYCPDRPTGPVPPGLPGGHQPAPLPEPDYLALAAKAAPRWGICPHRCFHRASHAGVCVECGCPTSALVQGSFSRAAQASAVEERLDAAVDAAMDAIPCSCDAEGTAAGTVHEPHCDTQIPPDVVRKMVLAARVHLAPEPPSAPEKPAPGTRGDSDADYLRARLRAAAARERAAQHQATSTAMHSHDGLALHSHAVRPDHQGVNRADGKGQK